MVGLVLTKENSENNWFCGGGDDQLISSAKPWLMLPLQLDCATWNVKATNSQQMMCCIANGRAYNRGMCASPPLHSFNLTFPKVVLIDVSATDSVCICSLRDFVSVINWLISKTAKWDWEPSAIIFLEELDCNHVVDLAITNVSPNSDAYTWCADTH